jgi:hypothetical protein
MTLLANPARERPKGGVLQPTSKQRSDFLERHLANALFAKLQRGSWRYVKSGETPPFRIYGAGQAPPIPGGLAYYTYAWMATVSPSVPRLLLPMHALFLDMLIYDEALGQFTEQTRNNWYALVDSGVGRLYYLQDNTMRRNSAVHPLMCAVATALVQRLLEMKLVVPVAHRDHLDLLESHEQQLVRAALGYDES